jgi:cytochrome bd-type quinol oxidase subunit 1
VLVAFFLESTFIGLWWFGKDRLKPWMRLGSIWLVAIGTQISAFWIVLANAWMHHSVGYEVVEGQARLTDFSAVVFNYKAWLYFAHVQGSAWVIAVARLLVPAGVAVLAGGTAVALTALVSPATAVVLAVLLLVLGVAVPAAAARAGRRAAVAAALADAAVAADTLDLVRGLPDDLSTTAVPRPCARWRRPSSGRRTPSAPRHGSPR